MKESFKSSDEAYAGSRRRRRTTSQADLPQPACHRPQPPLRIPEHALDPVSQWLDSTHGAISHNTERALRSDLAIWLAWCRREKRKPWPARAATLVRFIDAKARCRAPATVRRLRLQHLRPAPGRRLEEPPRPCHRPDVPPAHVPTQGQKTGPGPRPHLAGPGETHRSPRERRGNRENASSTCATGPSSPWPTTPC